MTVVDARTLILSVLRMNACMPLSLPAAIVDEVGVAQRERHVRLRRLPRNSTIAALRVAHPHGRAGARGRGLEDAVRLLVRSRVGLEAGGDGSKMAAEWRRARGREDVRDAAVDAREDDRPRPAARAARGDGKVNESRCARRSCPSSGAAAAALLAALLVAAMWQAYALAFLCLLAFLLVSRRNGASATPVGAAGLRTRFHAQPPGRRRDPAAVRLRAARAPAAGEYSRWHCVGGLEDVGETEHRTCVFNHVRRRAPALPCDAAVARACPRRRRARRCATTPPTPTSSSTRASPTAPRPSSTTTAAASAAASASGAPTATRRTRTLSRWRRARRGRRARSRGRRASWWGRGRRARRCALDVPASHAAHLSHRASL